MTGFSMSGRVLWAVGGAPMANVDVLVDGSRVATTSSSGHFTIETGEAGAVLALSARAEHSEFVDVRVTVTQGVKLPTLVPRKLAVCGKVLLADGKAAGRQRRQVTATRLSNELVESMFTETGTDTFCGMLEKGRYRLSAVLSDSEVASGAVLMPKELVVNVDARPLLDLLFTQLSASIKGQVQCIGESSLGPRHHAA